VWGGDIYTSTDSGATWTDQTAAGSRGWASITSSSDGTKLAAVVWGGDIYTSTDSGATWTDQTATGSRYWESITSSPDGTKLAAAVYGGDIYTSTDSGATWTDQTAAGSRNWQSITSSPDSTKLAAVVMGGDIYTSTDGGATWTDQTAAGARYWYSITSSSDGTKLAAVEYGGDIYTSTIPTASPPAQTSAPTDRGGGMIVGSGPLAPSAEGLPGYIKPRPQIDYPDGHTVYLDEATTTAAASSPSPSISALSPSSDGIMLFKNHQLYDRGEDIRTLQKFFNTHGFVVAQGGPGSPGNETSVFGTNTYRTVIKFQKANNLPATGYLGPITRALINSQEH
jgi:photosystem II stability/assembly factor-like uncharacterized protein